MAIMTAQELANKCVDIANNYKTLYVLGGFGAPLNKRNKDYYTNYLNYNKQASRTKKILEASSDTFAFDCVCLIKGILWGWNGDASKMSGGATYKANGVPDIDDSGMINVCHGVSTNFSNIEVGEAVWMPGHIGIYIGNGLAVESTPKWKDGVQITAVLNIGSKKGYNGRRWTKHGKIPYVTYENATVTNPSKVYEWQIAAQKDGFKFPKFGADGEWGAECEGVAEKAVIKKRTKNKEPLYLYPNLTRIVQKAVGLTGDDVDGKCGAITVKAIKAYQTKHGLEADGHAGINTWKKILNIT